MGEGAGDGGQRRCIQRLYNRTGEKHAVSLAFDRFLVKVTH